MSAFFVVIIFLGWFLSYYFGSPNSFLCRILQYRDEYRELLVSDKIVLAMSGAKPASREVFELYTVTVLSQRGSMPKLYVITDPAPNAFATGRNKEHGVVCATTGLLQL